MNNVNKNTETLLKLISKHQSGRKDCRQVEYIVIISDHCVVDMQPKVLIFPSTSSRRKSDRMDIVAHILQDHLDSFEGNAPIEFVNGGYVYRLSISGNRRKWYKMK